MHNGKVEVVMDRIRGVACLVAGVLLFHGSVEAQRPPAPGGERAASLVVLTLVDSLEEAGAKTMLLRSAGQPGNYLLVTSKTTPADVARAMGVLIGAIEATGRSVADTMRAFVGPGLPSDRSRAVKMAEADLRRLPRASPLPIPGHGRRPGIVLRVVTRGR
jgi:hypothetical protein